MKSSSILFFFLSISTFNASLLLFTSAKVTMTTTETTTRITEDDAPTQGSRLKMNKIGRCCPLSNRKETVFETILKKYLQKTNKKLNHLSFHSINSNNNNNDNVDGQENEYAENDLNTDMCLLEETSQGQNPNLNDNKTLKKPQNERVIHQESKVSVDTDSALYSSSYSPNINKSSSYQDSNSNNDEIQKHDNTLLNITNKENDTNLNDVSNLENRRLETGHYLIDIPNSRNSSFSENPDKSNPLEDKDVAKSEINKKQSSNSSNKKQDSIMTHDRDPMSNNQNSTQKNERNSQPTSSPSETPINSQYDNKKPLSSNVTKSTDSNTQPSSDLQNMEQSRTGIKSSSIKDEINNSKHNSNTNPKPNAASFTRILKDRTNYASFDCGAQIQSTNSETKSPSAILQEDKDKYMINQCSVIHKFVVLELCDFIRVDTIHLANFEFFSSVFKDFKVFAIDKYPPKRDSDWLLLGSFTAKNMRGIQKFQIENPRIWTRYLKLELLTHYGSEYLCPVSLFKVFGSNMMEDLHQENEDEEDENKHYDKTQTTNSKKNKKQNSSFWNEDGSYFSFSSQQYYHVPDNRDKMVSKHSDFMSNRKPFRYEEMIVGGKSKSVIKDINRFQKENPFSSSSSYRENSLLEHLRNVMETAKDESKIDDSGTSNMMGNNQENVFKTIFKRLRSLERNSTIALRLMEEQSLLLDEVLKELDSKLQNQIFVLRQTWNMTVIGFLNEINRLDNILTLLVQDFDQREAMDEYIEQFRRELNMMKDEYPRRFVVVYIILFGVFVLSYWSLRQTGSTRSLEAALSSPTYFQFTGAASNLFSSPFSSPTHHRGNATSSSTYSQYPLKEKRSQFGGMTPTGGSGISHSNSKSVLFKSSLNRKKRALYHQNSGGSRSELGSMSSIHQSDNYLPTNDIINTNSTITSGGNSGEDD